MKKLRLNVEALRVDPFVVDPALQGRGTVVGANTLQFCSPSDGYDYTCRLASCFTGSPCRKCAFG